MKVICDQAKICDHRITCGGAVPHEFDPNECGKCPMNSEARCVDICPECGFPVTREEVDIGVGMMHGPAKCNNCGWDQNIEINEIMTEVQDA